MADFRLDSPSEAKASIPTMIKQEPSAFQDQLLRGLTHKMNNILSLFHGYLGMLLEDSNLDPATATGLKRISEGAFAASELMDRIQSLARPSSVVFREIDINELLRLSKNGLQTLCTRGISVEVICTDGLPTVSADVGRLRAVLSELVNNAIDASPDNAVVTLKASMDADSSSTSTMGQKKWAVISISNQGPEITPDVAKRMMEPFFTTRQNRNAFGLGLTVAASMLAYLGGTLSFERLEGETICKVRIPSRPDSQK